jgi:hypothetical protein
MEFLFMDTRAGVDIEDTVKAVSEYVALGYKAIRALTGVPGLQTTYGVYLPINRNLDGTSIAGDKKTPGSG